MLEIGFGSWLRWASALIVASIVLATTPAWADMTATGVWEQINEKTGEAQSTVTISKSGESYIGVVTSIFVKPGNPANPICVKCSGALKNQPMKGLQIINGMKQNGLDYSDGTILDPESGTLYSATMQMSPDGKHLTVRGYIGISAFGRSQVWNRVR
jgi:uncharacterized protein (DUF2147 family)